MTKEKLVLLVTPTTLFSVDNHHATLAHELAHTSYSPYRLGRDWVS
jgi:antirestriction protein ArdC